MTEIVITDVAGEMRAHVARKYRKQCVAAAEWGVSSAFVSMVLTGRKPPTNAMMADAGIEQVTVYRRTEQA